MTSQKRISQKYPAHGEPLKEYVEDVPVPKGKEVLVKITSAGVCHSDIHLHEGYIDMGTFKFPWAVLGTPSCLALGHEIVGEAVAKGPDANIELGKKYIVWPWMGCMKSDCVACQAGSNQCPNGNKWLGCMVDGGFSTHVIAPEDRYCVPFGNVPEEFAATLACSGLTAYGAIKKSLVDLPNGFNDKDKLLIFGAGGLGLQAVKIVRAMFPGYKPAVADIDPKKREAALAAGASEVIDPSNAEEMAKRGAATMAGQGFARIIDFVGAGKSVEAATALLRVGSGTLTIVGLFGGVATLPVSMIVMGWKLQGHGTGTLEEMKELTVMAMKGQMDPIPIQNRKLEEANTVLEELKAGKIVGRAVLKPNGP